MDGEESKQNIVTDEFRYTFNYNTDFCEIPAKISGAIKATPKNPVPEYDTQKAYKFEYSSAVNMVVTKIMVRLMIFRSVTTAIIYRLAEVSSWNCLIKEKGLWLNLSLTDRQSYYAESPQWNDHCGLLI